MVAQEVLELARYAIGLKERDEEYLVAALALAVQRGETWGRAEEMERDGTLRQ